MTRGRDPQADAAGNAARLLRGIAPDLARLASRLEAVEVAFPDETSSEAVALRSAARRFLAKHGGGR